MCYLFFFVIVNVGNIPRRESNLPTSPNTFLVFVDAYHVYFHYRNHGFSSAFFPPVHIISLRISMN